MKEKNSLLMILKGCLWLVVVVLCSCAQDNSKSNNSQLASTQIKQNPKPIHLYSFKGFLKESKLEVYRMLKSKYPNVILEKEVDYPKAAYYSPRNRYWADSLSLYLCKLQNNEDKIVGLASCDISYNRAGVNYGCMGKATSINGKGATFSTFRLKKDSSLQKQLHLLVLHEVGHLEGLRHCPDKNCLMQAANGKNFFLKVNDFCPKCKKHLIQRGWIL